MTAAPPATLAVMAPLTGGTRSLAAVPDPVFAERMVGAGMAVEPPETGESRVVSPIDGTVLTLHPHAFVVLGASGTGILVHLGIDTVHLQGEGFVLHTHKGAVLAAGDPVVTFGPAAVRAHGLSAICPVVVLDSAPDSVADPEPGRTVTAGDPLFRWG